MESASSPWFRAQRVARFALTPSAGFAAVGAFALTSGSKDAAVVVTLPAGQSYTAQVSGVGEFVRDPNKRRPRTIITDEKRREIVEDVKAKNLKTYQIAEKHGVTTASIYNITHDAGQEEIMAEFDRVFGDPPSSVKNPTAYREKGKVGVLVIIVPADLRISQVVADLGGSLAERYLLILSNFYVRGLLHKKVQEKLGSFLSAHNEHLRKLGGDQYRKLIQYGLDQRVRVSGGEWVIGSPSV